MLPQAAGLAVTFATLLVFAWIGVRAAARFDLTDRDRYLTARGSQTTTPLALSFFASVLGTWILFAPPEVGTFAGLFGILGYAVGQAAAIALFAFVGPRIREAMPEGSTILEFVRRRFGRAQEIYVAGVSVLYMFVFLAAELTAIGGVLGLLAGAGPLVPVLFVAAVTAAYTAYGGLPASLGTDRWQGWLILALVLAAAVAVVTDVESPMDFAREGGLFEPTRSGAEAFAVLFIAIVAANVFHQGFWQRVWSARDNRQLTRGALAGAAAIVPVVFLMGAAGAIAAGRGPLEVPSLAFFTLLEALPGPLLAGILVLAVALVASSVDTLQNALVSLASVHLGRTGMPAARIATLVLTIPVVVLAVQQVSVLRLFLIADLLAATVVLPVLFGLWSRCTPVASLAGSIAGLTAIVVFGWVTTGSLIEGAGLVTLPRGLELGPFLVAPLASGTVAAGLSLASGYRSKHPGYHERKPSQRGG